MTEPTRPEGVVLHTQDGASHPVELTYTGVRQDGIHVWHANTAVAVGDWAQITADILPARTTIALHVVPA